MRIGIIAEGHSDRAVIVNIISGITGMDESDFQPLLPQYKYDATDLAAGRGEIHGGWNSVKDECKNRIFIDDFFLQEQSDFIAIHFDTAESADYGIVQPEKGPNYCKEIRSSIINKINEWIGEDLSSTFLYAISVEEMDAWILTLLEDRDSSKTANAKKRIEFKKGYRQGKMKPDYQLYFEFSKEFNTNDEKRLTKYLSRNKSLHDFYYDVKIKVAG
ncbi:hypothetical protein [Mucilaginibacter sp.]|uniref:hypothetical protein n=1 Tax=Mucilaginibacter sp. TaxID=1882438 RepID=UPI00262E0630|nr:hypothetical protein [Mucilaginibacter sp.]MDB4919165.1 hypothetical protein [Mucilaginibacter sp.]